MSTMKSLSELDSLLNGLHDEVHKLSLTRKHTPSDHTPHTRSFKSTRFDQTQSLLEGLRLEAILIKEQGEESPLVKINQFRREARAVRREEARLRAEAERLADINRQAERQRAEAEALAKAQAEKVAKARMIAQRKAVQQERELADVQHTVEILDDHSAILDGEPAVSSYHDDDVLIVLDDDTILIDFEDADESEDDLSVDLVDAMSEQEKAHIMSIQTVKHMIDPTTPIPDLSTTLNTLITTREDLPSITIPIPPQVAPVLLDQQHWKHYTQQLMGLLPALARHRDNIYPFYGAGLPPEEVLHLLPWEDRDEIVWNQDTTPSEHDQRQQVVTRKVSLKLRDQDSIEPRSQAAVLAEIETLTQDFDFSDFEESPDSDFHTMNASYEELERHLVEESDTNHFEEADQSWVNENYDFSDESLEQVDSMPDAFADDDLVEYENYQSPSPAELGLDLGQLRDLEQMDFNEEYMFNDATPTPIFGNEPTQTPVWSGRENLEKTSQRVQGSHEPSIDDGNMNGMLNDYQAPDTEILPRLTHQERQNKATKAKKGLLARFFGNRKN